MGHSAANSLWIGVMFNHYRFDDLLYIGVCLFICSTVTSLSQNEYKFYMQHGFRKPGIHHSQSWTFKSVALCFYICMCKDRLVP